MTSHKRKYRLEFSNDYGIIKYTTTDFIRVNDIYMPDYIPKWKIDKMMAEIEAYNSPLIGKNVVLDIINKYCKGGQDD